MERMKEYSESGGDSKGDSKISATKMKGGEGKKRQRPLRGIKLSSGSAVDN